MTKTFTLIRTASLAVIATGFVALAPLAHAAEGDQVPQAEMNIAGTDFTSAKAVDHLVSRLHRVAIDLCVPDGQQIGAMTGDQRACVAAAVKTGMAQIDSKRQQALRDSAERLAVANPAR